MLARSLACPGLPVVFGNRIPQSYSLKPEKIPWDFQHVPHVQGALAPYV